jgi:hypothetical protein
MKLKEKYKNCIIIFYITETSTMTRTQEIPLDALELVSDSREVNSIKQVRRSQWPRGLRRRSAAARLLRSRARIPPRVWTFVCCQCCVLSGRGLCDELIACPEEFYGLWCVVVCDPLTSCMRRPNQSIVIELKIRRYSTGCISYMPLIVTVKHDCCMSSNILRYSRRWKKIKQTRILNHRQLM